MDRGKKGLRASPLKKAKSVRVLSAEAWGIQIGKGKLCQPYLSAQVFPSHEHAINACTQDYYFPVAVRIIRRALKGPKAPKTKRGAK